MGIYFVSGIDTNIGKTIAVGLMAKYLISRGVKVITAKLVQTGNVGFSEDLDLHRRFMETAPFPEDLEGLTHPAIFKFPASPHLAAKLEGRQLDLGAIDRALAVLAERYEVVLVEGAGGLAVPLTEELLTVDWAAQRNLPLILVTSGRLGSLSHTIQSIEMATRRNLKLAGVVYNWSHDADPTITPDTARMICNYLQHYQQKPVLVETPRVGDVPPIVDFSAIFGR